jgi:hypothetical protein
MSETLSQTSLHARAAAMHVALQERRRLKELSGLIVGFETQRGVIANARDQLSALVSLRGILVSRGIVTDTPLVVAQDALRQVRQLRVDFTADAASIVAPRRLNTIRSDVAKTIEALRGQLSEAWGTWAVARIPSVNDEVLGVLSQISELRATVSRVRVGIQRLSQSAISLPANEGAIDAFVRDAEAVTEAWNSLDTQHLSPRVLQFLREAGSPAGARLEALSPEVNSWLYAKGLADSFRIRAVITPSERRI